MKKWQYSKQNQIERNFFYQLEQSLVILSMLILSITSCSSIDEKDIQGNWSLLHGWGEEPVFCDMDFKAKHVELVDCYFYKELGQYQIIGANGDSPYLEIKLDRDGLLFERKISILEGDSIIALDSILYRKSKSIDVEPYKLVDISTDEFLSNQKNSLHVAHYYQSKKDSVVIRVGQDLINYDEISYFLSPNHRKPKLLLFLGGTVSLQSLKKLYYYIKGAGLDEVYIVTKKKGLLDAYVLKDEINIWWDDLAAYTSSLKHDKLLPPLPAPRLKYTSRETYLESGAIEIKIEDENDFFKIQNLSNRETYLILIDTNMSLKNYLELKKILNKLEKSIITELE